MERKLFLWWTGLAEIERGEVACWETMGDGGALLAGQVDMAAVVVTLVLVLVLRKVGR